MKSRAGSYSSISSVVRISRPSMCRDSRIREPACGSPSSSAEWTPDCHTGRFVDIGEVGEDILRAPRDLDDDLGTHTAQDRRGTLSMCVGSHSSQASSSCSPRRSGSQRAAARPTRRGAAASSDVERRRAGLRRQVRGLPHARRRRTLLDHDRPGPPRRSQPFILKRTQNGTMPPWMPGSDSPALVGSLARGS